jgi:hypothetical protein
MFASGLPVISHATSIASLQAETYVSRFQSRCAAVGLRQLTAKYGTPAPTAYSTKLRPEARSAM